MKKIAHSTIKNKRKSNRISSDTSSLIDFNSSISHSKPSTNELVNINQQLIRNLSNLRAENVTLLEKNEMLLHHIDFLESIFSGLPLIVSIRNLKQNNLLWHNDNFKHFLGYHHKELQDINSSILSPFYHPDDIDTLKTRSYCMEHDKNVENYTCILRLKDKLGRWISFNSDWKVIKRDINNKPLWVLETLSDAVVVNIEG